MKKLTLNSPYGYLVVTPFNIIVRNGTKFDFCHVLGDKYVVSPIQDEGESANIRLEIPRHWLTEE